MMLTERDMMDIICKRIANDLQKKKIREALPPQEAERICDAIDRKERAEHLMRLFKECMEFQQKQQQTIQAFLQQYNNR